MKLTHSIASVLLSSWPQFYHTRIQWQNRLSKLQLSVLVSEDWSTAPFKVTKSSSPGQSCQDWVFSNLRPFRASYARLAASISTAAVMKHQSIVAFIGIMQKFRWAWLVFQSIKIITDYTPKTRRYRLTRRERIVFSRPFSNSSKLYNSLGAP